MGQADSEADIPAIEGARAGEVALLGVHFGGGGNTGRIRIFPIPESQF